MATTKAFELGDLGTELVVNADGTIASLNIDTDGVTEGSTNLYFTNARARGAISVSGNLTYDSGTGVLGFTMPTTIASLSNHDTDDLTEGTGNLYFTTARARSSISGGTGITYSSSTGQVELTASGVTAGSYGSASAVPVVTVDTYGRITGVTTTAVAGVSSVSYDSNSEVLTINTSDGGTPSVDLSIGGSLNGPLDEITVKYLASAPSTPIQGQFYFDSLNQKMKVYTGSAWVDAVPQGASSGGGETTDAVATMEKYTYTISSTTNAVSGSDDNSNTLSYIVDGSQNIEVYVNGIKQVEGATNDYVATTGTSVAFTYNLPSGSVVDVQVYELLTQDAFYLKTETYTQSEVNTQISTAVGSYLPLTGGTLTGDLTTTGLTVDTDTLHVDSVNNRVGIGNTNPARRLDVSGEIASRASAPGLYLYDSNVTNLYHRIIGGGDAGIEYAADINDVGAGYHRWDIGPNTRMFLSESGKLGIGTTSPVTSLDVRSSIDNSTDFWTNTKATSFVYNTSASGDGVLKLIGGTSKQRIVYGTGTGVDQLIFSSRSSTSDTDQHVLIGDSGKVGIGTSSDRVKLNIRSATAGSPVEVVNLHNPSTVNGSGTQITFSGFNAESTYPTWRYGGISGVYDTTSSGLNGGGWGGQLRFFVNRGGSAAQFENVMTLTGGGNVGIGTSSPDDAKLEIAKGGSDTVGNGHIGFAGGGDPLWAIRYGAYDFDFRLDRSYAGWQSKPVISARRMNGHVGIGTDDPSASLQVGDGTDQREYLTINSLGGYYSGIKLARGAGDWSSLGNNNYGMLVTDGGFEISKFTNKGNNENGRTAYFQLDDTEVNVNQPFGLLSATSDPTATRSGQIYYNSTTEKVRFWNGSKWQDINSTSMITSNLLLHWDMTDPSSYSGSGSTVTDISGNGYNGTIQGNPTYSSNSNGYMVFDGFGDYITSSFTQPSGARSFGMWVYYDSLTQPNGEGYQLAGIQAGGGYTYQGIVDGGNVYFYIGTGTGGTISYQLSAGQWYYQCLTFDGSTYNVYVNGVSIQTGSANTGTTSNTFQASAINGNYRLYGRGAEWQFYGKGLTQAEVQQNFNAGRGRYGI